MILFKKKSSDKNDKRLVFFAIENNIEKGECILELVNQYAEVTSVTYNPSTAHITEGLIRAAFNYAANKGFYIGKCSCADAKDVLCRMNFEYNNGEFSNDIPSILMGKCCCENKASID